MSLAPISRTYSGSTDVTIEQKFSQLAVEGNSRGSSLSQLAYGSISDQIGWGGRPLQQHGHPQLVAQRHQEDQQQGDAAAAYATARAAATAATGPFLNPRLPALSGAGQPRTRGPTRRCLPPPPPSPAAAAHGRNGPGRGHLNSSSTSLEGPRGRHQGYRRLWRHVTQVGCGGRLGEGCQGGHFPDVTVEELLEVVRRLAPEASAVQAVSQGLYYMDSGALAALLKELHKSGHTRRAQEIFDWLRSLPESHELYSLCNTMTFTTMISQCGTQQQLRRALELVAEMRARGVQCNVHTYSALMNVCIKGNELDLALDVYRQMLSEHCTPNLVTYNTLIDVYGKTGAWEEAVCVLDALERQGIEPEIRTYNTVIIACNMSGQAAEALRIYERMLAAGAEPTATTYTALISAYGKSGQLDAALSIFEDMVRRGCERNVITYSSLISACEKAARWELALDLLREMHTEGCRPNVVTFNSLIAACAQGAQWQRAQALFDQMQSRGCRPDSVTFGGLISAYDRAGLWRQALATFEQMKQHSCRPDSVVYNIVVGCLWKTGLLWAQARAAQIYHAACRQGHFRLTIHTLESAASSSARAGGGPGSLPTSSRGSRGSRGSLSPSLSGSTSAGLGGSPTATAGPCPLTALGPAGSQGLEGLAAGSGPGTPELRSPELLSPARSLDAPDTPFGALPALQRLPSGCCSCSPTVVGSVCTAAAASPAPAGSTTLIEFGMHAFTVGSAVLSLLRWVFELRERLPGEPTRELRHRVCLVLNKGKPGRDQAYPDIRASLQAMLAAWAAPMSLTDVPQGCAIEGRAGEVAVWLRTPAAEAALAAYARRGGARSVDLVPGPLARDAFFAEDTRVEARCMHAFAAVQRFEASHVVVGSALPPRYLAARCEWFQTAAAFATACGFEDEVISDTCLLLDRTVAAGGERALSIAPAALVVAAVLTTARQAGEQPLPADTTLEQITGLTAACIASVETVLCAILASDTSAISALRVAKLYLERLGAELGSQASVAAAAGPVALRLLPGASCAPGLRDAQPSLLAAAVLRASRQAAGVSPFWPQALATLTGLSDGEGSELRTASDAATRLLLAC